MPALQMRLVSKVNRLVELVELQVTFPQPTVNSVNVLVELRFGEGTIDDRDSGMVYRIGLRSGIVQLGLHECQVRPGARPDDLMASRSRPRKIKVVNAVNAGIEASATAHAAALSGRSWFGAKLMALARARFRRTYSSQKSYSGTVDERSVFALPGERWMILPDQSTLLDRTYLADKPLCQIEAQGRHPRVDASFHVFPRDIVLKSIDKGLHQYLARYFSYNKIRIAAVLVAKGLAEKGPGQAIGASSVEFCRSVHTADHEADERGVAHDAQSLRVRNGRRISKVLASPTSDFKELVSLAKIIPGKDFRHSDLTGVDFGEIDLYGFDFTGSDLRAADLRRAKIEGAIFDDADITTARQDKTSAQPSLRDVSYPWMKSAPDPRSLSFPDYRNATAYYPRLEPQEEYMLAKRFSEHNDVDAASRLYTSHLSFVLETLKRWLVEGVSFPDAIAAGNTGLAEAIMIYDPERGIRLSNTARMYIQRRAAFHILDHFTLVSEATPDDAAKSLRRSLRSALRRDDPLLG